MANVTFFSLKTISRDHENYHGWSTITRRRNGELLVVCSGGREAHVCPWGRVDLIRSADDGRNWSNPVTLADGPIDDRDAGVTETKKGTLLVTWFTSLAFIEVYQRVKQDRPVGSQEWGRWKEWNAHRFEKWTRAVKQVGARPAAEAHLGHWVIRSTDGGKSWSNPIPTIVSSPHGPTQLKDGRLLYVGRELWSAGERTLAVQSLDEGRSWQILGHIPTARGDDFKNYHEPYAVEAANGTLIAHIRDHNTRHSGQTIQTESADGGRTWTTPHPIGVWGLPSHILRLRDGRLVMTYGYRRPPFGNQARVSEDHGKTWSDPITLSDDGLHGDLGYPSSVQLDNGNLLTVWYEVRRENPRAVLRQLRWRLD